MKMRLPWHGFGVLDHTKTDGKSPRSERQTPFSAILHFPHQTTLSCGTYKNSRYTGKPFLCIIIWRGIYETNIVTTRVYVG
jgi:hypothetical protein